MGICIYAYYFILFMLPGYLSTGDEQMPGNYGLQDQVLGLKWVNKYIEYFRGNASCVTLYGNSAGSSSVGLLMLTNQTQGNFK